MAGRARTNALRDLLDKETLEYFEIDPVDQAINPQPVPSHLDYVCARIESGTTAKALAKQLSEPLGYELTHERLTRYLRELFGADLVATRLSESRARASHCYAEEALEIVDAPAYDSVSVQQARARAAQRNWMAERYNRRDYGSDKGVSVNVSIASLHLDALRSRHQEVTGVVKQVTGSVETALAQPAQPIAITSHSNE